MTCSVNGCAQAATRRGWCRKHYERWNRHGDPEIVLQPKDRDPLVRAMRSVIKVDSGCWVWQGSLNADGYGCLRVDKRWHLAHRWLYEQLRGSVPIGLDLDHLCRNRACVNPDCLEPVIRKVNLLRGEGFAAQRAQQTHCVNGHEFTSENTKIRANGTRLCRACGAARARAKRLALKGLT